MLLGFIQDVRVEIKVVDDVAGHDHVFLFGR